MMSRRTLLSAITTGGSVPAMTTAAEQVSGDPFTPESLEADVRTYAAYGNHQTGGVGDIATGKWVKTRLGSAGFGVKAQPIEVAFFDAVDVSVRVGDLRLECLPQHPVSPTTPEGMSARLALHREARDDASLKGAIAVVTLPFARHSSILAPAVRAALSTAARSGAKGIVAITDGPSGEAIALNAPETEVVGTTPTAVIGPKAAAPLIAAAIDGKVATLTISGQAGRRPSANIIASRPGPGPTVVVTTPLSGWFRCGGERGGGVATFLALAKWLPRAFPNLRVIFAGTVGHELENAGSHAFLESEAPMLGAVELWVHLGANFAARDFHETAGRLLPLPSVDAQRFLVSAPEFIPALQSGFAGLAGLERPYPISMQNAAGEAGEILRAGHTRLIANYGNHRFHHTPADGPEMTSGRLVAVAALGMKRALTQILSQHAPSGAHYDSRGAGSPTAEPGFTAHAQGRHS